MEKEWHILFNVQCALSRSITSNSKGKKFVIFQTAFALCIPPPKKNVLPLYFWYPTTAKIAGEVQFTFEADEQTRQYR